MVWTDHDLVVQSSSVDRHLSCFQFPVSPYYEKKLPVMFAYGLLYAQNVFIPLEKIQLCFEQPGVTGTELHTVENPHISFDSPKLNC